MSALHHAAASGFVFDVSLHSTTVGERNGIRLMRGKPFVAGIVCKRGGFENNFARQKLF